VAFGLWFALFTCAACRSKAPTSETILPAPTMGPAAGTDGVRPDAAPQPVIREPPGPDRDAVCAAVASHEPDKWKRFGDSLPVLAGGRAYFVLARAAEIGSLLAFVRQTDGWAIIGCGSESIVWRPVEENPPPDVDDLLGKARIQITDQIGFNAVQGADRARAVLQNPQEACRVVQLICRFKSRDDAAMRTCVDRGAKQAPLGPNCQ
jgi:hypothetical protein